MEIDLTPDVSPRPAGAPADRHRGRIITAAALVIGLAVGCVAGLALGRRQHDGGQVALVRADLVGAGRTVTLRYALANFGANPARITSVVIAGEPVTPDPAEIAGRSVAEFVTPVRCGADGPPQVLISVADGAGQEQNLGHLGNRAEWAKLCSP